MPPLPMGEGGHPPASPKRKRWRAGRPGEGARENRNDFLSTSPGFQPSSPL